MALAGCLQCGVPKIGALTPCLACGYDPSGERETVAKSILLSDHHLSAEGLQEASARTEAGKDPDLDEEMLAELAAALPPRGSDKIPIGCRVAVWLPIVVLVALAGFVSYLYLVRLQ